MERRQKPLLPSRQCSIASCRTGAGLRIELRLLEFQNRRGELRVYVLFVHLPAAFFGAPPPMKDIVRRKAFAICPAQRKKFCIRGRAG